MAEQEQLSAHLRDISVARERLEEARRVGARSTEVNPLRADLLAALTEGVAAVNDARDAMAGLGSLEEAEAPLEDAADALHALERRPADGAVEESGVSGAIGESADHRGGAPLPPGVSRGSSADSPNTATHGGHR
ncbi:MAG: hypothetical protein M3Y46_08590 [Actinomycetota bacterium]|nr:hypothetical protein [Actinomycetota bacterium]